MARELTREQQFMTREQFIQRLVDAGWTREDAEREAREVLDEGRDDD